MSHSKKIDFDGSGFISYYIGPEDKLYAPPSKINLDELFQYVTPELYNKDVYDGKQPTDKSIYDYYNKVVKFPPPYTYVPDVVERLTPTYPELLEESECPECDVIDTLWSVVIHLNDVHKSSREDIADYIELLSMDREGSI